MTATLSQSSKTNSVLYLALELSWTSWRLAFVTHTGENPRLRTVSDRNTQQLLDEITRAKARFGLSPDTPVRSVYEAGRDGFWLHRFLQAHDIDNCVVDSASIEVNRKQRRAKTDRLDAAKLAQMLLRYHGGEVGVWSVLHVPTEADEARRHTHRELDQLKRERTGHVNRIRGLLASYGVAIARIDARFVDNLAAAQMWNGQPVPEELQQRLQREFAHWQQVQQQIEQLDQQRVARVHQVEDAVSDQMRKLLSLKAIGINSAWLLVMEILSWRQIRNRRELAALVGLAPTPYASGSSCQEQGISKAGHASVRAMLIEISWGWLRWQPHSALSVWFEQRFGANGKRHRRVGIVALARKLLVALWRYVEQGEVPEGAVVVDWQEKLPRPRVAQTP